MLIRTLATDVISAVDEIEGIALIKEKTAKEFENKVVVSVHIDGKKISLIPGSAKVDQPSTEKSNERLQVVATEKSGMPVVLGSIKARKAYPLVNMINEDIRSYRSAAGHSKADARTLKSYLHSKSFYTDSNIRVADSAD